MRKVVPIVVLIGFIVLTVVFLATRPVNTSTLSQPVSLGVIPPEKISSANFRPLNATELKYKQAEFQITFDYEANMGTPRYTYNPQLDAKHEIGFLRSILKLRITSQDKSSRTALGTRQLTAADGNVFEVSTYSDSIVARYDWGDFALEVYFDQAYQIDMEKLTRQLDKIVTTLKLV